MSDLHFYFCYLDDWFDDDDLDDGYDDDDDFCPYVDYSNYP